MFLPVTTLSAVILAVLLVNLSLRVIDARRSSKVALGDGGNEVLQRRIRGQANLAEYAPAGLLLILVAELQSANMYVLAILAAAFVLGRLLHGYALGYTEGSVPARFRGMQLTIYGLLALAGLNLWILFVNIYS